MHLQNESLYIVSVNVIIIIVGPGFDHKFRFHETDQMALVDQLVLVLIFIPSETMRVKPELVVDAADPVVGIGLHGGGVLAPVLPEEDVHHDAVHRAAHIPGFQQLPHPLSDQLNRVDGTAPDVTANTH